MKILHLTQGYFPAIGGTEFLIKNISERMVSAHNDNVTVLTTTAYNTDGFVNPHANMMAPGTEGINGVTVRRMSVNNRLGPLLRYAQYAAFRLHLPFNDRVRTLYGGPIVPDMTKAVINTPVDVIAASSFPLMHMYYAVAGAKRSGRPVVLIGGMHPEDTWGFNRKMIYKAIKSADKYIAYTVFEKDVLIAKGIDEQKIEVVGCGVDPAEFQGVNGDAFKEEYGLVGHPIVAFVGQQGGHKGIEDLIRAMRLVWKRLPETRLVIAGARTSHSGIIDEMLRKLPKRLAGRVIKIDDVSQERKREILHACDVFASPSGYESFGITFLEAWIVGKPVVGTRNGALPSVITENVDGLLTDYGDSGQLAGMLLELLYDERLRAAMGEAGRAKVLQRYTWDAVVNDFRRVYASVV